jgi:hypothetical protein
MALVTAHWAGSQPNPVSEYHDEFALRNGLSRDVQEHCYAIVNGEAKADDTLWSALRSAFTQWKMFEFSKARNYGTWHLNHDPRDWSVNIEVGALCMGGEGVGLTRWGTWPYTAAHAVYHAAIIARICKLKNLDPSGSFDASVAPKVLQNGPIHVVSTHAERAIQTYDAPIDGGAKDEIHARHLGYFAFSGDPDCRWDLAALDPREANNLTTPEGARAFALHSAQRLRNMVVAITAQGIHDLWGLDLNPIHPDE